MKCEYCNATNLTLEDEFCPYCGALNAAARKHIEDMRFYNQRFEDTENEVKQNVSNQIKLHTQIIVIVILVVINLAVLFANINMYEIASGIREFKTKSNAGHYIGKMKEYEKNEEFLLLEKFYSRQDLYMSDAFDEYSILTEMINYYDRICRYIYYLENEDVDSYYSKDEMVEEISGAVIRYYELWNYKNNDYFKDGFSDEHMKSMNTIKDRIEAILTGYCKLSKEEIESLPNKREAEVTMLIGRGYGLYE